MTQNRHHLREYNMRWRLFSDRFLVFVVTFSDPNAVISQNVEEAHANRSQNSYCHDFERTGGTYKLELTWYSKDKLILVELHLLIENAALSNAATDLDTENMPTMMSIEAIFRRWKAIHFIHTIFELFLIFSLTSRPARVTLATQRYN